MPSFFPLFLPQPIHPNTATTPDPFLASPGNAGLFRVSGVQVQVRAQLHHILRAFKVGISVVELLGRQHLAGVEDNRHAFGDGPTTREESAKAGGGCCLAPRFASVKILPALSSACPSISVMPRARCLVRKPRTKPGRLLTFIPQHARGTCSAAV